MMNPVEWAEQTLGAQQVWEEVRQANLDYEREAQIKAAFASELRIHEADRVEKEFNIRLRVTADLYAQVEGTGAPRPSEALVTRVTTEEVGKDELVQAIKRMIVDTKNNLDGSDAKLDALKRKIHAWTARLEGIANLLRFSAACKEAETTARQLHFGNPATNWP